MELPIEGRDVSMSDEETLLSGLCGFTEQLVNDFSVPCTSGVNLVEQKT